MTDQEIDKIIREMKEIFGNKLPNPEVFPESFKYYYKLYKYFHMRKENETTV